MAPPRPTPPPPSPGTEAPQVADEPIAIALDEARRAAARGEVPVGAVVIDAAGTILARAGNETEARSDASAHAELLALRAAAARRGEPRLPDCTLVVTLEPCTMCAGAVLAARLPRVVFGAWDDKAGAAGSVLDVLRDRRLPRAVEVISGVLADRSAQLLQEFFAQRR
jgi:tRNA(adenine34) deaminase